MIKLGGGRGGLGSDSCSFLSSLNSGSAWKSEPSVPGVGTCMSGVQPPSSWGISSKYFTMVPILEGYISFLGLRRPPSFHEDLTPLRVVLFSFRGDLTSSRVGLCSFRGHLTSSRMGLCSFRGDHTSSRVGLFSFRGDLTSSRVGLFSFRGDLTSSRVGLCSFRGYLTSSRVGLFSFRGDLTSSRVGLCSLSLTLLVFSVSDIKYRSLLHLLFWEEL